MNSTGSVLGKARRYCAQCSILEHMQSRNMKRLKKKNMIDTQGFLKADAAPITTAKTKPRPAPREAPTAADVKEYTLAWESALASFVITRSRANSHRSLSLASSFRLKKEKEIINQNKMGARIFVNKHILLHNLEFNRYRASKYQTK